MLKVEASTTMKFQPVRLVIELNSASDLRTFEAMVADVCEEGCSRTNVEDDVDNLFACIQKAMEKMYEQR